MSIREMVEVLREHPRRELIADGIVLVALTACLYGLTVVAAAMVP